MDGGDSSEEKVVEESVSEEVQGSSSATTPAVESPVQEVGRKSWAEVCGINGDVRRGYGHWALAILCARNRWK